MPKKHTMIASDELKLKVKKLQFLEESNKALLSIQDKLEQLTIFHKETIFSYDIRHILKEAASLPPPLPLIPDPLPLYH